MDIDNLLDLYKTYGFDVNEQTNNLLCFTYKKGRYFGVDVIQLEDNSISNTEIETAKAKYSKLGFAINIKNVNKDLNFEEELFKSFFSYDTTIKRLKKKYIDFTLKQSKNLLGNNYEYINTPYEYYDHSEANTDNLLDRIISNIYKENAQLVIIEAAAGYGKTCAAYELLNKLIQQSSVICTPLFTELAKNRGANIFKYVLLDEIDNEFPTLNSQLVIHEVKNGRVPLIIDGFDELLVKVNISNVDEETGFEEIESMLDTIGNLLEEKSKIILTTRKTAIFSGIEFDKWLNKWNGTFEVTRISIKEPSIKDWLGDKRFSLLKDNNIPFQYIANPVLLSYLRNVTLDDYKIQLENPEILVEMYFQKMLEREIDRQNLRIKYEDQYNIFKNIVKLLLDFDITVESKEFFKEMLKDQNVRLLENTRSLYPVREKPTIENLVDSLATHALLDRKGRNETLIGFINDFVLGIFIGEILCETDISKIEKDYSFYMLDLACTAYKVQNSTNRLKLWNIINQVTHKLQPLSIFTYDINLKGELSRNYFELTIYNFRFYNTIFDNYNLENIAFLNCTFKNCEFNKEHLLGISFIECSFDNCRVLGNEFLDNHYSIAAVKCKVIDCNILEHQPYYTEKEKLFNENEDLVIRKLFLTSGSDPRSYHIITLLKAFDKAKHKELTKAINSLVLRNYIQLKNNHLNFNINLLNQVKDYINEL